MWTEGFRHIVVVQETSNRWKGVGKFVPIHSIKTYKRSIVIAPPILNPDTRLKLQVSFSSQPPYLQERNRP